MAVLTVLDGEQKGQTFFLEQPVTRIGRREGNDWVLPDASISGVHCEVERNDKGFLLRDLGSTNGTKVNNVAVKEKYLSRNDIVLLGDLPVEISGDDIQPNVTVLPTSVMRKTMVIQSVDAGGKKKQIGMPEAFTKKSSTNKIWIAVIAVLVLVIVALLVKMFAVPQG